MRMRTNAARTRRFSSYFHHGQGNTKNLKPKSPPKRAAKQDLKKGRRAITPKKAGLVKQVKLRQELSAKINHSVEGQMVSAASSGKLTIMKNAAQGSTDTKTKKP